LESRRIKRAPVIEDGKLVGIISRSNLVQALSAIYSAKQPATAASDAKVRASVEQQIGATGVSTFFLNVVVAQGVVDLWGIVGSQEERAALRIAAESTPGVKAVNVHLTANPQLFSGI
jgi:signal-transduction protein with cAMP-binding, CBS, and nucleotidyltransferase domain